MTQAAEGHIENFFLAKKTQIEAYHAHSDVLILDCTYKTNQYKMPLLNIVGFTGANTTLQIAVVFLCSEQETDYFWALSSLGHMMEEFTISKPLVCFHDQEVALVNAFERVFPGCPTMLCLWHVFKNVSVYAKSHGMADEKIFATKNNKSVYQSSKESSKHKEFMSQFSNCVYAKTEAEFIVAKKELSNISPGVYSYVELQYLGLWKHKVAMCYRQSIMCFGISTTARGKGAHSTMKSWLDVSKANIHESWVKMNILWTQQHDEYQHTMALAATKVSPARLKPFWAAVNRHVHIYALQQAFEQWSSRTNLVQNCTHWFTNTTGIPCRHVIAKLIDANKILERTHFHPHWWIDRRGLHNTAPLLVLLPKSLRDLRAEQSAASASHQSGAGKTGNRRIPSQFERPTTSAQTEDASNVVLPTVQEVVAEALNATATYNQKITLRAAEKRQLPRERQIRGRVGTHWCTIASHFAIDGKLWFNVLWDHVPDGEANPTQQDELDFIKVGMGSLVNRYKRAQGLSCE